MTLFDLVAKLTMDSSGFDKGVRDAENAGHSLGNKMEGMFGKVEKIAKAFVGGAVIKKVTDTIRNIVDSTAEVGDKIDKQSQVLGMSRKAYQEWDYILGQNGASIESMGTAMKTLNNLILSGVDGSKESADALAELGIHLEAIDDLSQEDQFETVVKAFQRMPAGAQKSALAVKIFGKQGMQLLPLLNQESTSIDELRARAEELGLIMSDDAVDAAVVYGDSLDDLHRTFDGFKYAIGSKILPVLTTGIQNITNYAGKLRKAYDEKGLVGVWDTLVDSFKNIKWPTWDDVSSALEGAWNGVKEGAKSVLKLVFGETADGGIAFPTSDELWGKIKETLSGLWGGIQKLSHTVLKLAFGEDEDGGINFPTSEEVWEKIKSGLDAMWTGIKENAKSILKLFIGTPELPDAHSAGEALRKKIGEWWTSIKENFKSVLKWFVPDPSMEDEDGTSTQERIQAWWDTKVKPELKNLLNFVLGLFDLPTVDEMKEKIVTWWNDVKTQVGNLVLNIVPKLFGIGSASDLPVGEDENYYPGGYTFELPKPQGFAIGSPYIPYNNMPALLHRGEKIMTATQARNEDNMSGLNINALANTIASSVKNAIENATIRSYINGKDITDEVNRGNMNALKSRRFAT